MSNTAKSDYSHKLLKYGVLLFLFGLITGFVIPVMQNPRMGLSSHLEAIMNGMFLILLGLLWPKLNLSKRILKWGYYLSLYSTFTNWITTLLAGIWGAGAEMMPIAGKNLTGAVWQEGLIQFGLISLSLAMVIVSVMVLWGLRVSLSKS
jgi:hydroxylaminobenzene mutase